MNQASSPVATHFSHAEEAYWPRYAKRVIPTAFIRNPILTSAALACWPGAKSLAMSEPDSVFHFF
jgi:hypothetical protein